MKSLSMRFKNPAERIKWLSLASAILIGVALAAWALEAGGRPALAGLRSALMAAAAVLAGSEIAVRAFSALRRRHASIELLVTIATAGALVIGEYWEAAAVTFLFIFGAYLESRTLSQTRKVIADLLDLAPLTALVIRGGQVVETPAGEVETGEMVLIRPGAKVPVDGKVLEGYSAVGESAITGEPVPEEKAPGDAVFAGTINHNGALRVQVTGAGADTTLARIIARVEEAQEQKAPTQRFIEKFARWYTPAIIVLSVLTYLLWRNIDLSLTLLVIGCPGALVISTPVSVIAGIGQAARRGILIKGGEYLENAGRITTIALDKTGTITQGRPAVTDVIALQPALATAGHGAGPDGKDEVLYWAAAAEASSEHPLARAIAAAGPSSASHPRVEGFENRPGKGIAAEIEGRRVVVGTRAWIEEQEIEVNAEAGAQMAGLKADGKTAVLVAVDGSLLGVIAISDPLRPEAPEMVRRLRSAGVKRIAMLTGDDEPTARSIAAQAGITEVHAALLPEHKLELIRQMQLDGSRVAMVGDGINDAPALAAADIGIAMGAAGTSVAIETADIALLSDSLAKIPEAVRLSRATLRNIRQNTVIALVTVAALLAGVLLDRVHMAGGMLVHQASVMIVILNGMRLLRK